MIVFYRGCLVNSYDINNATALMIAAAHGNKETVELLLKYHADITITDNVEKSPIFWAAEENSVAVLEVCYISSPRVVFIFCLSCRDIVIFLSHRVYSVSHCEVFIFFHREVIFFV